MVQLLFKFSWSKLDEIFTKSVSDCNQQPNEFKNSPRKKLHSMAQNDTQTDRQTDMATLRPTRPRGPSW